MLVTALDAKTMLEAEGLHVSCNDPYSLWIAANVCDVGDGVQLSQDACLLRWHSDRWIAAFPTDGLAIYEVPGTLVELVSLITAVYAHYRITGGDFKEVFKEVVSNAEQYLVGRTAAPV